MRIPLCKPYFPSSCLDEIASILDSGWVTEGPATTALEEAVVQLLGEGTHAIATSNCTMGLEIALQASGIEPGDEVIVPDFTFPATATAVQRAGAVPVLVDVSRDSITLDPTAVERALSPKTRAIVVVSTFGYPADYEALRAIADANGLFLFEDAACSLGSRLNGRPIGTACDWAVFSFHPRKFITTGEGGMIVTKRSDWAARVRSLKRFGGRVEESGTLRFVETGTNAKLSNVLAALGLSQLAIIDELLQQRVFQVSEYMRLLGGRDEIAFPPRRAGAEPNYQTFGVLVERRDEILSDLRNRGIEAQIGTYALHREPAFASGPRCRQAGPFEGCTYFADHFLALPLFHELNVTQIEEVCSTLLSSL